MLKKAFKDVVILELVFIAMIKTKATDKNSCSFAHIVPNFVLLVEKEYQHHIVMKHPGKPGYPNTAVA